jgi:hypothetical protein
MAQALAFGDTYYGDAGSAKNQAKAWGLLGDRERSIKTFPEFAADWKPYRWAEVLSVKRDSFYWYTFSVRGYLETGDYRSTVVPGLIRPFRESLRLVNTDAGIELDRYGDRDRDVDTHILFPRVEFVTAPTTYRAPRVGSSEAPRTDFLPAHGKLMALCELYRTEATPPASAKDVGWWTRTNLGWVKNSALVNGNRPVEGLPRCASRNLEK